MQFFFFAVQIVFDLTRALLFSSAHQEKEKPERADARHWKWINSSEFEVNSIRGQEEEKYSGKGILIYSLLKMDLLSESDKCVCVCVWVCGCRGCRGLS